MAEQEGEEAGPGPLCTRRQVLIWGGVSIIGLSAVSSAWGLEGGKPLIIMEQAQGLIISDPVLCVGCGRCELACTEFNDGRAAPSLSRIRVERNINFGSRAHTAWREGHGNFGDGLIVQNLCKQCPHPVPYADIEATSTSASTVYLYSGTFLEPEYAAMLAEWLEVGQFESA